jgi:hypothetical protein
MVGAPPRIHRVILLDREVDLVTPLMTQITLEGLIDEVTGIRAGAVPWAPRGEEEQCCSGYCCMLDWQSQQLSASQRIQAALL